MDFLHLQSTTFLHPWNSIFTGSTLLKAMSVETYDRILGQLGPKLKPYFESSNAILPFENCFESDKLARKYPDLAKVGTPDQANPPSHADPKPIRETYRPLNWFWSLRLCILWPKFLHLLDFFVNLFFTPDLWERYMHARASHFNALTNVVGRILMQ